MSLFTIQNLQETKNTFVSRTDTKKWLLFQKEIISKLYTSWGKKSSTKQKKTWLVGGGFNPFDQYQSN